MPDRPTPTVLAVDDEQHIRELVRMGLAVHGFQVAEAADGRGALAAVEGQRPDLVVLDVMLPDLDGFEVARRIRAAVGPHRDTPIIFLTARDGVEDRVKGLKIGSDDYLTKPFSIEELVERVRAVLRRSRAGRGGGGTVLEVADLVLDVERREVWRAGELVELTPTEHRLLQHLLEHSPRVLTREQILDAVWGYGFSTTTSVLDTYISTLRQKVDAVEPHLIRTVRGVGYTLRAPR